MRTLDDLPPPDPREPDARPPRAAERFLAGRLGPGPRSDFIIGDLREEYAALQSRWPAWLAALWYWTTILGLAIRLKPGGEQGRVSLGIDSFVQDLRFGLRSLRKGWAFTVAAIATLAVGIGATTAVLSIANGILFRSLPYPDADRLAVIQTNTGGEGWYGSSQPEFMDFQEGLEAFESLGVWRAAQIPVNDSTSPRRLQVGIVSSEVLPLLGVAPAMGRFPTVEEDRPDGPRVLVVSHGYWQQDLGGDPDVLGRQVDAAGNTWTIVAVMPPGFDFPTPDTDVWLPFRLDPLAPNNRANHNYPVIGRLASGVSFDAATAQVDRIVTRARELYPQNYDTRGYRTRLISLQESLVGSTRAALLLLLGGALLVLLVACVNVSNLLIARGNSRETELAVRGALGASRGRVVRQLLLESGVLAVAGGVAGLALGALALEGLVSVAPASIPRLHEVGLDPGVLALAFGIAAASLVAFGVLPAVHVVGGDLRALLGATRGSSGRRSRTLRRALVVAQLALAGILALGAGTMVRTLANLYGEDFGFDPEGRVTMQLNPDFARYPQPEERLAYYDRLVDRIRSVPGVDGAAAHLSTPLDGNVGQWSIEVADRPVANISDAPDAYPQMVTPGYFELQGIRLVAGRAFTDRDGREAPGVAVVNETMARTLWPGEDPIGKRFRMFADDWPFVEVVGVVGDVRNWGLDQEGRPEFYVPYAQSDLTAYFMPTGMSITVRGAAATGLVPSVRAAIADVDPTTVVSSVRPMDQQVAASVSDRRFVMRLLNAFGAVALLLAAIGVYGVMSLAVGDRVREIAVRKALGARGRGLVGLVLRETLVLAGVGAVATVAGGIALGGLVRSVLYRATPTDPLTLIVVGATLAATATLAAAIPAARASRVDPMAVLRTEA